MKSPRMDIAFEAQVTSVNNKLKFIITLHTE